MVFFGHRFTGNGIAPDSRKVEDLQAIKRPSNPTEVKSLRSSAAFCARFIQNFATITKPLGLLTVQGAEWTWDIEQQQALEILKAALSTQTTLGYFDPDIETVLYVDASPIGLGAVLTQSGLGKKEIIPIHSLCKPTTDSYRSKIPPDRPRGFSYLLGHHTLPSVPVWKRIPCSDRSSTPCHAF